MQAALKGFIEEIARRDATKSLPDSAVRTTIRAYVNCMGIAYRQPRELTPAQLDRALRYYRRRRSELRKQPMLLAA